MTIVVTMKVTDGIVLAADSASSFFDGAGAPVKIYNNANKIFNLVKVWPIGAMIYGNGGIGHSSIETLSKDLRRRLSDVSDGTYGLDKNTYTIEEVAIKARQFLFEEVYQAAYGANPPTDYYMGYRVCGYSAGASLAETWEFKIVGATCGPPEEVIGPDDFGPRWAGENEALDRLILGSTYGVVKILKDRGMPDADAESVYMQIIKEFGARLYIEAMPIQDAIDVSKFLVETAGRFARYGMRPETIGGPTEIAAITKHEGFRWIARKHYYHADFNRETSHA